MKKVSQMQLVKKNKQEGASLIEYAVIAAIIVVVAVAGLNAVGGGITTAFNGVVSALTGK